MRRAFAACFTIAFVLMGRIVLAETQSQKILPAANLSDVDPILLEYLSNHHKPLRLGEALALTSAERSELDTLCQQKDCAWSLLRWETSLEAAQARAKREHKLILSLRMLGDLREDLSCANSRFFRTLIYSVPQISNYMRQNFVLHWSAESDVPVAEIRFPGGKTLKTTITGNSVHYVLDVDGHVLDAFPGLASPQDFSKFLEHSISRGVRMAAESTRIPIYAAELNALSKEWRSDIAEFSTQVQKVAAVGFQIRRGIQSAISGYQRSRGSWPNRYDGTMAKARIESPVVSGFFFDPRDPKLTATIAVLSGDATWDSLVASSESLGWERMATLPAHRVHFSAGAQELIRLKLTGSAQSFETVEQELEEVVATDSLKNTYLLRSMVLYQLSAGGLQVSFEDVNRWMYDSVFLLKIREPYMGLVNAGSFLALDRNGLLN